VDNGADLLWIERHLTLVADQRREKCILAVEGDRHLAVIAGERSAIMLAAVGPDRTEAKAGLVKPCLA
jgi:hypothetical protein